MQDIASCVVILIESDIEVSLWRAEVEAGYEDCQHHIMPWAYLESMAQWVNGTLYMDL